MNSDKGVESNSTGVDKNSTVVLYWNTPILRSNGNPMDVSEIGGYEIRYRTDSDSTYTKILIDDSSIEQYTFKLTDAENAIIEIAAFDTDGIYSDFVNVKAR